MIPRTIYRRSLLYTIDFSKHKCNAMSVTAPNIVGVSKFHV